MKSKIERIDDIPLLVAGFEKSELSQLLNHYFPDHGNWQGTDGGKVTVGFLTYILSCSDHRISYVEDWAKDRIITLRHCLGDKDLRSKDFTDDKLTNLLERFSDEERWSKFEHAHNQRLINVYQLELGEEPIRLDAMITQSHRSISEDGADFQYGHSKQHRADLPQLKTMVASLDPMAMPLFSLTVSGNTADDVLYLPVLKELLANLDLTYQLFVGDSKMGSIAVRSYLDKHQQYYLVPLSKKQCSEEELNTYLTNQRQEPKELIEITKTSKTDKINEADKSDEIKAKGFEIAAEVEDKESGHKWTERRIVVYSPAYANRQKLAFENRLNSAKADLTVLLQAKQGRKKLTTYDQVHVAVQQVLRKYKLTKLMEVSINETITNKKIRAYGNRPERVETTSEFQLQFAVNEKLKQEYLNRLGWRVYACNAPKDQLSTKQAILCYRNEYRIEHKFDELLNRITALMPVLLKKPHRIKALIRLLLLALKYVSLIQHQVRSKLNATKQKIKELYPGNPGRSTDKPSTSLILGAFRNIHLNIVSVDNNIYINISDLKPIQLKILDLLNFKTEIYRGFKQLSFSYFDFSEI